MKTPTDARAHFETQYKKCAFFSPRHIRFVIYDRESWARAAQLLKRSSVVVDLGSGGGTVLYNISKISSASLIGIDFSDQAGDQLKRLVPRARFMKEDVTRTTLREHSCDFVISTMTVEHVDDQAFFNEAFRILRPGGYLFVTSVLKKPGARYFYKNKFNESVLDPTHLREYASDDEFARLLSESGFHVIQKALPRICFPLADPLIKLIFGAFKGGRWRSLPESSFFEWLRLNIQVPIPGYRAIEVLAQKRIS